MIEILKQAWTRAKPRREVVVILACVAFLIGMVGLFYAVEDWRGWHAWNQFKKEWEVKGVRFDRASVTPPPVADDQNFALTPIAFSTYGGMLTRDGKSIPKEKRDTNFVNRLNLPITRDYADMPDVVIGKWTKAELTDLKPWQDYYRALAVKTNEFPMPPQLQAPAADVLLALSK